MSIFPRPHRAASTFLVAAAMITLGVAGAHAGPADDVIDAAAVAEPEVLVFVTSWCPYCRQATSWMKAEGIPHLALDVEADPRAAELYRRAGGSGAVPLIVIGGKSLRGFDPSAVRAAIDRARVVPQPADPDPAATSESGDPEVSGVTKTVGADGKAHYVIDDMDLGGEVHAPHVEFVTTRPDVDEVSASDPATEPEKKLPLPDSDEIDE